MVWFNLSSKLIQTDTGVVAYVTAGTTWKIVFTLLKVSFRVYITSHKILQNLVLGKRSGYVLFVSVCHVICQPYPWATSSTVVYEMSWKDCGVSKNQKPCRNVESTSTKTAVLTKTNIAIETLKVWPAVERIGQLRDLGPGSERMLKASPWSWQRTRRNVRNSMWGG